MKFFLRDIEIWFYDGFSYPVLLSKELDEFDNIINNTYDLISLKKIENKITEYLKRKYKTVLVMNPLYIDESFTVITFDVSNCNSIKNNFDSKLENSNKLSVIHNLIKERELLIRNMGLGKKRPFKLINKSGIFFSKEKKLMQIEKSIYDIVNNDLDYFLSLLRKKTSERLLLPLRWAEKSEKVISYLLNALERGGECEKNEILLQLIPAVKRTSSGLQKNIFDEIDKTLVVPSSRVRNKSFSLMVNLIDVNRGMGIYVSKELRKFIYLNSLSEQKNISFPAKKILEQLAFENL